MKKLLSDRNVTVINFLIIGFFLSIYMINLYEIDAILIGVYREMFTIPFLLALIVFSILGIVYLLNTSKKKAVRVVSSILIITCSFITIRSLFI